MFAGPVGHLDFHIKSRVRCGHKIADDLIEGFSREGEKRRRVWG